MVSFLGGRGAHGASLGRLYLFWLQGQPALRYAGGPLRIIGRSRALKTGLYKTRGHPVNPPSPAFVRAARGMSTARARFLLK